MENQLTAYFENVVTKDGKEYFYINIYLPGDDTPISENIYVRPDSTLFKMLKACKIVPRKIEK